MAGQGSRQCITVYKQGKRAGLRCGWRAMAGSVHCAKHSGSLAPGEQPKNTEARKEGNARWWQRIKSAKEQGFITCLPQHAKNKTPEVQEKLRANVAKARAVKLERQRIARALLPDPPPKGKPGRPKMTPEERAAYRQRQNKASREKAAAKRAERRPLLDARKQLEDGLRDDYRMEVAAKEAATPRPILTATKVLLAEKAALPALPDKPFDQMEPHEKLTALTGLSLDYAYKILTTTVDPVLDPKLADLVWKAASSVMTLRVKVDKNELASRKIDGKMDLLERLRGERQVHGTVIDN